MNFTGKSDGSLVGKGRMTKAVSLIFLNAASQCDAVTATAILLLLRG